MDVAEHRVLHGLDLLDGQPAALAQLCPPGSFSLAAENANCPARATAVSMRAFSSSSVVGYHMVVSAGEKIPH